MLRTLLSPKHSFTTLGLAQKPSAVERLWTNLSREPADTLRPGETLDMFERLPPAEAAAAIRRLKAAIGARTQSGDAQISRSLLEAPSDVSLWDRLSSRNEEAFEVRVEPRTGLLILREKEAPWPPALPKPEPDQTRPILRELFDASDDPVVREYVEHGAQMFPPTLVELLRRLDVRFEVSEFNQPSPRIAAVLGRPFAEYQASAIQHRAARGRLPYRGCFEPLLNLVQLEGGSHIGRAQRATILGHEVWHVLDHALRRQGAFLSEESQGKKLFEDAHSGTRPYLTKYSEKSVREFVAEAGLTLLRPHWGIGDGPGTVRTRQDLLVGNPELYAYALDVISVRLPQALAEDRFETFLKQEDWSPRVIGAYADFVRAIATLENDQGGFQRMEKAEHVTLLALKIKNRDLLDATAFLVASVKKDEKTAWTLFKEFPALERCIKQSRRLTQK